MDDAKMEEDSREDSRESSQTVNMQIGRLTDICQVKCSMQTSNETELFIQKE